MKPYSSLALALLSAPPPSSREDVEKRHVRAVALADDEEVSLDGRLDETFWKRIVPAADFVQQVPAEGAPARERTEVRIAYDRSHLYLGVMLYDSEPDAIIGYQKRRDGSLDSDDRFLWILDTFLDGRSAYYFETNPAGLMGDGLLRVGSGEALNRSWDGIWEARVDRGPEGWSVEAAIPFRTLNFDPGSDTWGVNFQRTVRRTNEESLWSGHRVNEGIYRPIHAGRLTDLRGVSQGIGLEVTPYAAGAYRELSGAGAAKPVDVGIDLGYSVTPSLRAALTVNTDFAEVEVDERIVNLTRFPVQFPEQRDFFLEGSSVYDFARANGANPYFSRRIGLLEGRPIPIVYGARLNGKSGRYDVGFLQVRTGREGAAPPENFTIGRVKRSFLAQSSIGAIYTRRTTDEPSEEALGIENRHTFGVDLDLFTSTFLTDKNLQFEAFVVAHTDPSGGGESDVWDRSVRGVRLNFPNDRWRAHTSYREFGKDYDPAVGFVARNGFRRLQPSIAFAPRPASLPGVRQFDFELYFEYLTDLDNRLLTRNTRLTFLGMELESGDELSAAISNTFESLDGGFEISEGVVIPPGSYEFNHLELRAATASRRKVSGELSLTQGGFWSGDRTAFTAELEFRLLAGLLLAAEWEQNDVSLPAGDFTAALVRQRTEWQLSPWISFTSILQSDNVSDVIGIFTRFRWTLTPGSDLFFVHTHNWAQIGSRYLTLDRTATAKINYTYRF